MHIVKIVRENNKIVGYILSDNSSYPTLSAVARSQKTSPQTMTTRISIFGIHSPLALHAGKITEEVCKKYGVPYVAPGCKVKKPTKWDRKKCKREGQLCKSYSECQAARLKLLGAKEWIAPKDTDSCFEEVPIQEASSSNGKFSVVFNFGRR